MYLPGIHAQVYVPTWNTCTGVSIDEVGTSSSVEARIAEALVDVVFTTSSVEPGSTKT